MATTASTPDWLVTNVQLGIGQVWAGLAIPGAGARLTLHSDGTPDATTNTSAIHIGMTNGGTKFMVQPKFAHYFSDEFEAPILSNVDEIEAVISGDFLQVWDPDIMELMLPAVGTKASGSGYEEVAIGRKALAYQSIAVITPTQADATKFAVMHLYSAFNDAGLAIEIARKTRAASPFAFRGRAITSRAVTDTVGKAWRQVA